jgi:hypothetical protein
MMSQPAGYPQAPRAPKRTAIPRPWDRAVRILLVVGILIGLIGSAVGRGHLLFDWIGLCVVFVAGALYLVARIRH